MKALADDCMKPVQIARELKSSRATAYRYLDNYE
ncbi:hypothetical protein G3N30_02215 [Microbacterium lacticum]|nr:hypothetical protein [Microbacterium lacticum]